MTAKTKRFERDCVGCVPLCTSEVSVYIHIYVSRYVLIRLVVIWCNDNNLKHIFYHWVIISIWFLEVWQKISKKKKIPQTTKIWSVLTCVFRINYAIYLEFLSSCCWDITITRMEQAERWPPNVISLNLAIIWQKMLNGWRCWAG